MSDIDCRIYSVDENKNQNPNPNEIHKVKNTQNDNEENCTEKFSEDLEKLINLLNEIN